MEEVVERHRRLVEELDSLKSLVEHKGWRFIDAVYEGQINNRLQIVLKKTENLLAVLGNEYEKGELSGLQLARVIPYGRINDLETELARFNEEYGDIDDDGENREPQPFHGAGGESRDEDDEFVPPSP